MARFKVKKIRNVPKKNWDVPNYGLGRTRVLAYISDIDHRIGWSKNKGR